MISYVVRHLFPSVARSFIGEGYEKAIKDILVFKDKIYTEPVTMYGNNQVLTNVTCLGNEYGIKIVGGSDE